MQTVFASTSTSTSTSKARSNVEDTLIEIPDILRCNINAFTEILKQTEASKIWNEYKDNMTKLSNKIDNCSNKQGKTDRAKYVSSSGIQIFQLVLILSFYS